MGLNPTTLPGVPLTRRENQAMFLRAHGKERREIATYMGISRITVGQYFQQVKVKLSADDIPHAIRIYQEMQLCLGNN